MKNWPIVPLGVLVVAAGCGPARQVPEGAEVVVRDGKEVVLAPPPAAGQEPAFRQAVDPPEDKKGGFDPVETRTPAAALAADQDAWHGKLEKTPERKPGESLEGPAMTNDLAERLGGYRFKDLGGGRCLLHLTGVDIEGSFEESDQSFVVSPERIAGRPTSEAQESAALKALAKEHVLAKQPDGSLRLSLGADKVIRFTKGSKN